jgi:SAM-dependent methyltransferase
MANSTYIHGTDSAEQERLTLLNRLTNQSFIDFLALDGVQSVLEIGSGLGILTEQIATRTPNSEVWGVEYATEQLATAKTRRRPNLHFLRGDAHKLPFKDEQFDIAYCRYLLEHVADPLQVLREAHRVLKPGGKVCAQENNIFVLVLYPECPRFETVLRQFTQLQERLGGDALIGKKLLPLFAIAGFDHIELSIAPEIHYAGTPMFRPWIENLTGNVRSGAVELQKRRLATAGEVAEAIVELQAFMERDDASLFFYWNRAVGWKNRKNEPS